jgi:hypothetical protein
MNALLRYIIAVVVVEIFMMGVGGILESTSNIKRDLNTGLFLIWKGIYL